jgi:hypothetical protein
MEIRTSQNTLVNSGVAAIDLVLLVVAVRALVSCHQSGTQ